ncbi:MAG: hypothetical protein MZV63_13665 [Marinilabiliales bacterium]|nr:hypothetical protein [Marinilabiliales bacterium]
MGRHENPAGQGLEYLGYPERPVACSIARGFFDQPPTRQPSNRGYPERGPAGQER